MTGPWFRSRLSGGCQPTHRLLKILHSLAADSHNELLLATGRDRATSTNGSTEFPRGSQRNMEPGSRSATAIGKCSNLCLWTGNPDCYRFLRCTPIVFPARSSRRRSFRSYALSYCRSRAGERRRKRIDRSLLVFTASIDLQVLRGNKAIEIRKAVSTKDPQYNNGG